MAPIILSSRKIISFAVSVFLFLVSTAVYAAKPTGSRLFEVADSLDGQQIEITDSLAAVLEGATQDTISAKPERNRGYDASRYSMMKRYRPKNEPFVSEKFMDNTFLSASLRSHKMSSADYSFGASGGVSFGKWLNPYNAVRLSLNVGKWLDNFNASNIVSGELSADYLFNVVSYLGGYKPSRFCEASVLAGIGYSIGGNSEAVGHAFTGHIGFNISLSIFPGFDFFIEPKAAIYTNGMALTHAGNWRSGLSAFHGDMGVTYNFGEDAKAPHDDGSWFAFLAGGSQFQNSMLVRDKLGALRSLGMHYSAGAGKFFTRYFALRASLNYGRSKWVEYKDYMSFFTDYYSLRFEGLLDIVSIATGKDDSRLAFSLLLGPEVGFMHKDDIRYDVNRFYIGLTGGAQFKVNIWNGIGLFLEPRFNIVPYAAWANTETVVNDFRNYYDGLFSLNLGVEYKF